MYSQVEVIDDRCMTDSAAADISRHDGMQYAAVAASSTDIPLPVGLYFVIVFVVIISFMSVQSAEPATSQLTSKHCRNLYEGRPINKFKKASVC